MTAENLQIGGGYAYQWRCASLLALDYLLPQVRASLPELHNLIITFLGHVEEMYLEGVSIAVPDPTPSSPDLHSEVPHVPPKLDIGLEDISLWNLKRLLLLQIKTKEAEGTPWTLADPTLLKALYRFYNNSALDHDDPPIRFVFLSNCGFNPDVMELKREIANKDAADTPQADRLFGYLKLLAAGKGGQELAEVPVLNRARFDHMLAHLALIQFLPLSVLRLALRDHADVYRIDGEDTYLRLYTGISERSIQRGGARITLDDLYSIVPDLFAGRLADYIRSQPERAIADYLLKAAAVATLPPLGTTTSGLVGKIDRLISGHQPTLLTSTEAFVLLAAASMPHLLYRFAAADTAAGSSPTHQLAAVLPQHAAPPTTEQALRDVASAIEAVRAAHIAFVPELPAYNDQYIRGERLRIRLLATLLHLATQLHLDQHVDPTPSPTVTASYWADQRRWWHQAYIQSVTIERGRIQLSITLPAAYADQYRPWLVDPLDQELQRQITLYGDTILAPEGIELSYRPAEVVLGPVPAMADDDWQRLWRELRVEQARATADQHDLHILQAQQLRELLVFDRVRQAEQYAQEEQFAQAASLYAEVAERLDRAGAYVQAQLYARRSADAYTKMSDLRASADQHLFAAEVWLQNALSPYAAQEDLRPANQLTTRLGIPDLRIRFLLAQAMFDFTTLHNRQATPSFQEARALLPVVQDRANRAALAHALTVREATFAMAQEQWLTARTLLEAQLAVAEQRPIAEYVKILSLLLLVSAETGDGALADHLYDLWNHRSAQAHPEHNGILAMHYAANRARQGDLQRASDLYDHAITLLDGNTNLAQLGLAYQNKQFMLGRNGLRFGDDFSRQEARRIDLFNSQTHSDSRGYSHEGQALRAFAAGDMDKIMPHIRMAKLSYWRDGDWMGLEHIYNLQARWHEQENDSAAALLAAVRADDRKAAEKYSQTLRDTATLSTLQQVVSILLTVRPTTVEDVVAIRALGVLADVIPPTAFDDVIERLVGALQGGDSTVPQGQARQYAAEGLQQLVSQMDEIQAHGIIRLAIKQLARDQHWETTKELLRLITAVLQHPQKIPIAEALLAQSLDQALAMRNEEILRSTVDDMIFMLVPRLPRQLRARAVTYLHDHPNDLDSTAIRALLNEPLSEQEIVTTVEQILAAIKVPDAAADEESTIHFPFGGIIAQQLNNYTTVLPTSLYQQVVDSVLGAITSGRGELIAQADAVRAIWRLPDAAIHDRADAIIASLLQVEAGEIPRSGPAIGFGSIDDVRQASLHAMGRLYHFAGPDLRIQIQQRLVVVARDASSAVRLGVALACAVLDSAVQPLDLVLAVFVLLHDSDPAVVARACVAASHFIARGAADALLPAYIERLIGLARESGVVVIREGAACGLRRIVDTPLEQATQTRVAEALAALANDTSARVRQVIQASPST